ncbi:methyltransferase type 11 [Chelatococcus sp. GCM10030263]|uniref:methyltransferase type 11 n=1 Tax=Chelatococcus sp. GCM10030263 TaxID=3273387 RepID=UPI00361002FC
MFDLASKVLKRGVPAHSTVGVRPHLRGDLPTMERPISQLCTQAQFESPVYDFWCDRIREPPRRHRKQWEFVYILHALSMRGMLNPSRSGLGFGVGQEPLPAVMALYGAEVCATDLPIEEARNAGWVSTSQHSASLTDLNNRGICPGGAFARLVTFQPVNMNSIPQDLRGFDFTWSSCCLEHLGSIEAGFQFIEASLEALKPGGIAVHTTEFNCSSDDETITSGDTVLYRRSDILGFLDRIVAKGYQVSVTLSDAGDPLDKHVDVPPYSSDRHLRLQISRYVTTSIGLIIEKS